MKKVIFTILLIASFLGAQNSPKIPLSEFDNAIKNGLNESNATLNDYIVYLFEKNKPYIDKWIEKPFTPQKPQLKLSRAHYSVLLAYVKYLENKNKIDKVLSYYIRAYKGLHNIKNDSLLTVIYQIVISNKLALALKQSLQAGLFRKNEANRLYKELSKTMILNNKPLIDSLENQKKLEFNEYKKSLFQEKDASREYIIFVNTLLKIINSSYNSLIYATKTGSLEKLKRIRELEKKLHNSLYMRYKKLMLNIKINIFDLLSIENSTKDYETLAEYIAKGLYKPPEIFTTIKEYQNMVKENQKLLEKLKNIAKGKIWETHFIEP